MEKIVILGSPGAGKTTLAKELGSMLKIKAIHLDRLFWKRGWIKETKAARIDTLQNLVREKKWIIEGTYLHSSKHHLKAADTIIFLDFLPLLCLYRIIKRHLKYRGRFRRDIPEGCTDRLTLIRILKVLTFPLHGRRTIKRSIRNYNSKQIIRLRSPQEVEEFLTQLEQDMGEKKDSSCIVPVANKRHLVTAGR